MGVQVTLTAKEVLEAIEAQAEEEEEYGVEWWEIGGLFDGRSYNFETRSFDYDPDKKGLLVNGTRYEVEQLESTGGMDEGSYASVTFRVGDQYFRKEGYYASHYGTDWDGDFFEVKPVEKVVTVYEKV